MTARLLLRISAPSVGISLLLLAVGGAAGWYVHRLHKSSSELLDGAVASIRAAEEVTLAVSDIRFQLVRFATSDNRQLLKAVPPLYEATKKWVDEIERRVNNDQERELVDRVRRGYQRLGREFEEAARPASAANAPKLVWRLIDDLITKEILEPAQEYLDLTEETVSRANQRNQVITDRVALSLLLTGICGSAAGLVAGFGIARGVSRSIVQLYVPVRDASGKLGEVVGPASLESSAGIEELDTILHHMAEQVGTVVDRLHQSQLAVLRAEQLAALGQLAAGLAHELRNPLTTIKILVQTAAEADPATGLRGRDLTILDDELARLERSLQRFLDFAKPPTLERQRFDLREMIGPILELISARAARQGVTLCYDPPGESILLDADREHIRQVVLNLLLNALDALPRGGRIRVGLDPAGPPPAAALPAEPAKPADPGRGWVRIRVADNGPGLPAELGGRIFDPFVSTKETGLGLGLAICRRIAETHGGEITAANGPDGGAVFEVCLPVDKGLEIRDWGLGRGD
jgi:signal transduction histidine kinase